MMSKEDTGGPAFPIPELTNRNGDIYQHADSGMTLRDYFAANALNGGFAQANFANGFTFAERADWCYQQADAMLKAREA